MVGAAALPLQLLIGADDNEAFGSAVVPSPFCVVRRTEAVKRSQSSTACTAVVHSSWEGSPTPVLRHPHLYLDFIQFIRQNKNMCCKIHDVYGLFSGDKADKSTRRMCGLPPPRGGVTIRPISPQWQRYHGAIYGGG